MAGSILHGWYSYVWLARRSKTTILTRPEESDLKVGHMVMLELLTQVRMKDLRATEAHRNA